MSRRPSCRARWFISATKRSSLPLAHVVGERVGGVVRALDQRRLEQLADGQPLARPQVGARLADVGGAGADGDDVARARVRSTVRSTVISFVMLAIGTRSLASCASQQLAGRRRSRPRRRGPVTCGGAASTGAANARAAAANDQALQAGGSVLSISRARAGRRSRFVGSMPGLSASSCSTVVSNVIATSLSVSPARQPVEAAALDRDRRRGGRGRDGLRRHGCSAGAGSLCRPERTSRTAIVTASRKAAGAP